MELKNKRIAFLGDSITEGVGVSSSDKKYTDVFARLSGAEIFNYGISGTRIARQTAPSENPSFDKCFLDRVEGMIEDADVVVVFGGTNDFGHGDARFGEFSDRDEYSYYGALHSLIKRLVGKYPYSTVVFMTPLHRTTEDDLINEIGLPRRCLYDYVEVLRSVCEYYSIPVLDLYKSSGLQPSIPVIREAYMPDGLHPNDRGAEAIAKRLYGFLSSL